MTLYFDLRDFSNSADRNLLNRIPRRLADYYLAVPLAEEDGCVTVVTAHPENMASLFVLQRLLGAEIVPVSGSESAVQEIIARVYATEPADAQNILAWTDDTEWVGRVRATAQAFGQLLNQPVVIAEEALTAADYLSTVPGDECSLLIAHASSGAIRQELLRRSPAPLLLVRGSFAPVQRMLIILRGYGSDHQTVNRALPLLRRAGAKAMVLPLTGTAFWRRDKLPASSAPARAHLDECLKEMAHADVDVSLRLRQGDQIEQVIAELSQNPYDLLVMAAEARGDFVLNLLSRIESTGVLPSRPILIIKPPVDPACPLD